MTIWLRKRLAVLCVASLCGGAIWWNGGVLHAQGEMPKISRGEAAKNFVAALDNPDEHFSIAAFVARKSERELGEGEQALLSLLAQQWKQPNHTVRVLNEGDKTATVIVENDPKPPARPLVLVEEEGSWGVDLVETYALWNGLVGTEKFESIYRLTGVILDGLPRSEARTRGQCQTNLKQIALGVAQYVQDYDEKYPLAKPWVDILQPYVKSEQIFTCPALPKQQKYGYAYNSKLSNKVERQVAQLSQTVELYETSILKRNAYGSGENPAFRHNGGANYAFADGHVKWFFKGQTPSFNLKP